MILKGVTVLELAGLAPSQFCGKILADFGAKVIRIDKVSHDRPAEEILGNGKLSICVNLKTHEGTEVVKRLSRKADVLVEPFRAGLMEKLGIGPEILLKENKRLIYARMSGFGQDSIYSKFGGHDINFLSLSGILSLLGWGKNKTPSPPCNVIGDFAAGSLLSALGIIMALYEREKSGLGQVIDLSMTRGSSYLCSWIYATQQILWNEPRGQNMLDGGSSFYNIFETKDGKWMSVGSIEEKFYNNLLLGLNLTIDECPQSLNGAGFEIFSKKFKEKTQKEWTEIFKNLDACVSPVLSLHEAVRERPHDFVKCVEDDLPMPLPEPRFSRSKLTSSALQSKPNVGEHTASLLLEAGFNTSEINQLLESGAIYFPKSKL